MKEQPEKGKAMFHLIIRNLDAKTLKRLHIRAAKHGVSVEEEAKRIIRQAVTPPEKIGSIALSYFGEEGVKLKLPKRKTYHPVQFE